MEKPNTEKASKKELIVYIEHQEGLLSGVTQLQQQINRTCSLLAGDMEKINNGVTEGFSILSLDDVTLKKLMFTIKNKDFFIGKAPSSVIKNDDTIDLKEAEDTKPEEITGNAFEIVSKRIRLNGK